MNNYQKISEQNLNDIEAALVKKITRFKGEDDLDVKGSFRNSNETTFASLSWTDKNNYLKIKTGISRKRKGDVYNKKVGQLLALINMF